MKDALAMLHAARARPGYLPWSDLNQHLLIIGGPGSGKTSFLRLLIQQLVRDPDAVVVVIDPKGDRHMLNTAHEAVLRYRSADIFDFFGLPWPMQSVHYNPAGCFQFTREIPDRLFELFPTQAGSEFYARQVQWVVSTLAAALTAAGLPLTLGRIHYHAYVGRWELFHALVQRLYPGAPWRLTPRTNGVVPPDAVGSLYRHYKATGIIRPNPVAEELLRLCHEAETKEYRQYTAGLGPRLAPLTEPPLRDLLCFEEPVRQLLWRNVVRERRVVYFFLGSMLAPDTASTFAKLMLLDLDAFLGSIYAYPQPSHRAAKIYIICDELPMLLTAGYAKLVALSRGANCSIIMTSQTSADIAAILNHESAEQLKGNAFSVLAFRAQNETDAAWISRISGGEVVETSNEVHNYEPSVGHSGLADADDFRYRYAQNVRRDIVPRIPEGLMTQLPQYVYVLKRVPDLYVGVLPLLDRLEKGFMETLGRHASTMAAHLGFTHEHAPTPSKN
jgi:hypothetical protein